MEGGEFGTARCEDVFGNLVEVLSRVRAVLSSLVTYIGGFNLRKQWWHLVLRKGVYLDIMEGLEEVASKLAKNLAYLYFSRDNTFSTAVCLLSTIQYIHRLVEIDLLLKNHFLRAVNIGMGTPSEGKRHALAGR